MDAEPILPKHRIHKLRRATGGTLAPKDVSVLVSFEV